jgi:molybdopterin converting factor subunit 1
VIVDVKLFALARDLAGCDSTTVSLPPTPNVGQLRQALVEKHPPLTGILGSVLFAVNSEYANDEFPIPDGADVACIPPVSGG